eukprot:gnl/MRDRNA2_/MRDRNA2_135118_c0_seq1.p1 gnl/MRDRNA2_/MRDRNA2_135118_c0~~gnl/MRDRNA2_/MRDRNA2_135118_c0_seq1.p1  ORF type:complete len:197 (+),score=23.87 gnl/MRDRNA2_/MRDRNA2_135118_c0_seq1:89-679(+)
MGSAESVYNDTCYPTTVWWRLLGGAPAGIGLAAILCLFTGPQTVLFLAILAGLVLLFNPGERIALWYGASYIDPGGSTPVYKFTLSLVHEVCARVTTNVTSIVGCKVKWSPPFAGQIAVYQVSDIIGQETIPPCTSSAQFTASALTMSSSSNGFEHFPAFMALSVLASFMVVLIYFKKFDSFQKRVLELREPLTQI